jgi:hypothetical protein
MKMNRIELKINREFFEQILLGDKNFEIRLGDMEFNKGDTLILLEKDPVTKELTGRSMKKIITMVRNTKDINHWPKEDVEKYGLQIIGFK